MSQTLLRPELPLKDTLEALLAANADCIFAVAYIDLAAVTALKEVIAIRLRRKRFSLRVLFRARDLHADPAAIDLLLELGRNAKGRLEVRWSKLPKFHAKAFGFRRTQQQRPTVVIGSANLTSGAIGAESGELGVLLANSSVTDDAWETLEDFWSTGQPVSARWLDAYRSEYQKRKVKERAAAAVVRRWEKRMPTIRRSLPLPDLRREPLHVEQIVAASAEEIAEVKRASATLREQHDIEINSNWVRVDSRSSAYAVPRDRNILKLEWFGDEQSIRHVSVARVVRKPIRAVDPKSGKIFWLLSFVPIRGARLVLRRNKRMRDENRMKKHGVTWNVLGALSGRMRKRKLPVLAALKALGLRVK